MLVQVSTRDLRPGMFVARVNASWLHNPFWRNSFLITDLRQIARLTESGIAEVMIDVSKGRGLVLHGEGTGAVSIQDGPPVSGERRSRPRPFRNELDRAREILESSKAAVTEMFGEARLGKAISVELAMPLVEEIAASVQRDASAMLTVTRLKTKNEYTYMHSVAVCALMINFARHLGLPEHEVRDVGMAGMLHDIGKMGTPPEILDKPGTLTDDEMVQVRSHPVQGHAMLAPCPDIGPAALDVCLHHHERFDGKGYPFGLTGEQLSLHARMGAICDVYDAVTSERPYKAPWSPNLALARMLEWEGQFDPALLDTFVASLSIPPLGALVRLRSNRLALVIDRSPQNPATPQVRAFYAVEEDRYLPSEDVDTGPHGDPVIRLEKGSYWFGEDWPVLRVKLQTGEQLA